MKERFDTRPTVQKRRNVLPPNPETADPSKAVGLGRFPSWLHRKLPTGNNLWKTGVVLSENRVHTVCEEAKCPNLLECWSKKTATFLVLGSACTRNCGFCDIDFTKTPKPPEADEPYRVADSVKQLGLKHVVVTMVARDDLEDGGATAFAAIMREIRNQNPGITLEVLTSDFAGNRASWDIILNEKPEIFNHNIETVRELTPRVRHKATYDRSIELLSYVKAHRLDDKMLTKSGMMLGLGESEEQVHQSIRDLQAIDCDIITMGQYLQPNRQKLLVKSFVTPDEFEKYAEYGRSIGVHHMYCGPFVRSSYNANNILKQVCPT